MGYVKLSWHEWPILQIYSIRQRFYEQNTSKILTGKVKWLFRVPWKGDSNTWLRIHESSGQLDAAVS